jgi:peptidoglycan/LPS O-acetylase OafA/YrhL
METKVYFHEIHLLRGYAILLTLIAHFNFVVPSGHLGYNYLIGNLFQFWGGVELFFVISGFVISASIIPNLSNNLSRGVKLKIVGDFYIKRLFRIVPLVLFWSSFTLLCSIYLNNTGLFGKPLEVYKHYIAVLTFTENVLITHSTLPQLSIYWSLAIEEQFYLLFPFFLLIVYSTRFRICILATFILLQFFVDRPARQDLLLSMTLRFDSIMWGVLLYLITQKIQENITVKQKLPTIARVFATLFLLFLLISIPVALKSLPIMTGMVALVCAGLVFLGSFNGNVIWFGPRWFEQIVEYFATRSFSIYLSHMPIFFLMSELACLYRNKCFKIGDNQMNISYDYVGFFIGLIACILISEISYQVLEKPSKKLGQNLVNRNFLTNK